MVLLGIIMALRDFSNKFQLHQQLAWHRLPKKAQDNLTAWEIDSSIHMKNLEDQDIGFYHPITEHITVGGDYGAQDKNTVAQLRTQVILNMAGEISYMPVFDDVDVYKIGIDDGVMAPVGVYEEAARIIHEAVEAGKKIYVHCAAGISRSTTAVVTYLILYKKMPFWDAVKFVRGKRPCACPHPLLVRSVVRDLGERFVW